MFKLEIVLLSLGFIAYGSYLVNGDLDSLSESFKCLWKEHKSDELGIPGKTDSCFDNQSNDALVIEIKGALNASFVDTSKFSSLSSDGKGLANIFKCLREKLSGMDETTSREVVTNNVERCIPASNNTKINQIKKAVLNSFELLVLDKNSTSTSV